MTPAHVAPTAAVAPPAAADARGAYLALLAFVLAVYASAPQLVPALAPLRPGQLAIAAACALLAWSCLLCRRPFRLGLAGGGAWLYAFFGVVLASATWSRWPANSFDAAVEAVKYLAPFVVAVNVLHSRRRVRTAATVIALGALFPATGAIKGYFLGEYLVEGTRAAWLGTFGNPNYLAYTLVVATPIALALRESVPASARARALQRLAWLGVVGTYAAAIFLSGSRGGTLGLGAVLLLWLVRGLAHGKHALGAAMALGIALAMTPGGPWDRAETQATLSGEVDASAQGRLDAWRTAIRTIEANPLGGVGAGAFILAYDRYAPGDGGTAKTAHNSFLMIAAELGLPALAFFAFALLGMIRALGRSAQVAAASVGGALERGAQTAIFGFIVCSLTGGYTFTWPLYFVLGLGGAMLLLPPRAQPAVRPARAPERVRLAA